MLWFLVWSQPGGRPPRGVILNVSQRSVRAHGFGTLPHQAEIWFITRCPQLSGAYEMAVW